MPDWAAAGEVMDREWHKLMEQEYILVKHCGLSRGDIMEMTADERNKFISLLIEEREREREAAKKNKELRK